MPDMVWLQIHFTSQDLIPKPLSEKKPLAQWKQQKSAIFILQGIRSRERQKLKGQDCILSRILDEKQPFLSPSLPALRQDKTLPSAQPGGTCCPAPPFQVSPLLLQHFFNLLSTHNRPPWSGHKSAHTQKNPNNSQTSSFSKLDGGGQTPAGQVPCPDLTRALGPAEPQGIWLLQAQEKTCCKPRHWHSSPTPSGPPDKQQLYLRQELSFHYLAVLQKGLLNCIFSTSFTFPPTTSQLIFPGF